jgi:hypothetical protein
MKNKSYILVHREPYEGDTIYGVYSTEKKAQKALKLAVKGCRVDNFLILEVGVNQEPYFDCTEVMNSLD